MDPGALCEASPMTPPESRGSPGEKRLDEAINERIRLIDSGSYERSNDSILRNLFQPFLQNQLEHSLEDYAPDRDVPTDVDDLTVAHLRAYAEYLRERVQNPGDELTAASASSNGAYYTVVRAFLSFCVEEEWIGQNPARPSRVQRVLPEDTGQPDRQYWSDDARRELLEYVDQRVDAGIGTTGSIRREPDAITLYRDRALVATLAFAGVRGAEVLAATDDRLRTGLRWRDVDLTDTPGVIEVLGKSRKWEPVGLSDRVTTTLSRLHRILQPANDDWPVFPTQHTPTLSRTVHDALADRGYSEGEREELLADDSLWAVCYEYEIAPPALTVNGGRNLLKRLCDAADVDVDGEYLKPHGARRKLGDDLYETDPVTAQDTLRHRSIDTTHEAYRDEQARETARNIEEIVDDA